MNYWNRAIFPFGRRPKSIGASRPPQIWNLAINCTPHQPLPARTMLKQLGKYRTLAIVLSAVLLTGCAAVQRSSTSVRPVDMVSDLPLVCTALLQRVLAIAENCLLELAVNWPGAAENHPNEVCETPAVAPQGDFLDDSTDMLGDTDGTGPAKRGERRATPLTTGNST